MGSLYSQLPGDTSLYVNDTVIDNIKIGYYVGIIDDNGDLELGRVVDKGENYLILDKPIEISIIPGTYLTMQAKIIPFYEFDGEDKIEIGKDIPTAQRLPKNIPIRIKYYNKNHTSKKIKIFIEYLY